jgi:hypothetical protein
VGSAKSVRGLKLTEKGGQRPLKLVFAIGRVSGILVGNPLGKAAGVYVGPSLMKVRNPGGPVSNLCCGPKHMRWVPEV